MSIQEHLKFDKNINFSNFYTPKFIVDLAYEIMQKNFNLENFIFLDTSCEYGNFFTKNLKYIGANIDAMVLKKFHINSLINLKRENFKINTNDKLVIISNPLYNDQTYILKNGIKKEIFLVDDDLKCKDLGISLLRSYETLNPNFVCVFHPFSYLIKQSNFNALHKFKDNYRLIDDLIINSQNFMTNSSTFFPIILALYEKNSLGMSYEFIKQYSFKTYENRTFALKNFDLINNYVKKYSDHYNDKKAVTYFHISRDINVFKKNQTTNFIKTLDDFSNLSHNAKITQYFNNLLKVYA